jgi:hypothetical protein
MPGKEIKGRSKRAMYSNGKLVGKQAKLDVAPPKGVLNEADFKALGKAGSKAKTMRTTAMAGGMMRKKVMGGGSMMRMEKSMGGGLYENIKKKKDRIAAGSGEKMRKVGAKGAPTAQNFKDAAKTAKKA